MSNRNQPEQPPKEAQDFYEDANDLWSLYGKEAKSHDGARIETLKGVLVGVLLFLCAMCFSALPGLTPPSFQAGLFSAILTAFVVPKIQDLKKNSADQSAYYQNQTVQMLGQISQQLTSESGSGRPDLDQFLIPHCLTRPFICWRQAAE